MSFPIPCTGRLLRTLLAANRITTPGGKVIVIDSWLVAPAGGAR